MGPLKKLQTPQTTLIVKRELQTAQTDLKRYPEPPPLTSSPLMFTLEEVQAAM